MFPNHQTFTGRMTCENLTFSRADKVQAGATTHTLSPSVTGASVIGLKFKDGVMLAADNLASYGSMARFSDIERLIPVGKYTVVGIGGDVSDLQHIERMLDDLTIREQNAADGHELRPEHVFEYMSREMYDRRTKMNPLCTQMIIAGTSPAPLSIKDDETTNTPKRSGGHFLSYVDLLGTTYSSPVIATGMGCAIGIPLLRKVTDDDAWRTLSREDARRALDDAMKVLYYRDARSGNKFSVATVTSAGITMEQNQSVATERESARSGLEQDSYFIM